MNKLLMLYIWLEEYIYGYNLLKKDCLRIENELIRKIQANMDKNA